MDAVADPHDLVVGQSAERTFEITDGAIRAFAAVSGDANPVHLDEAYAARTIFKTRVAHGMLLGGHISAVLGDQLPGPGVIYQGQTLEFLKPVRIGDTVKVRVEVIHVDDDGRRATLSTLCLVGDKVVARGQALVTLPRQRRSKADA